ncbi:hypothetical protein [Bradyrhizobium sp. S3.5.5]|uniref:hypothetical protein n=1 Tax=unclassified Bradyrhizobium TaxID=2631580 RepID=UPI00339B37A3
MGATPQQLFRKVIVPAALPTIFVGIRLASAPSWCWLRPKWSAPRPASAISSSKASTVS